MPLPVNAFKIEREWECAGLKCAVVQSREAAWRCGYVCIPLTHPAFGKMYNDIAVEIHGGLTFSEIDSDGSGWWFGFDCAHYGDASYDPNMDLPSLSDEARSFMTVIRLTPAPGEHYWTQFEVEGECESLARQLSEIK